MNTTSCTSRFPEKYGPWALVAGASEGLGAAFARALAARGMHLVLVARRQGVLDALADDLRQAHGVQIRCLCMDLGSSDLAAGILPAIADIDVGLLVYNAAYAPVGEFASVSPTDLLCAADVNVRGPVALVRALVPAMITRKRGGVVLMSSLAGNQGSPRLATYAATKAFNAVLAEGLWHELRGLGIDVVACCAGAIRTPGYAGTARKDAPGTLDPAQVVEQTLRALGRGPRVVPGFVNKLASVVMTRLLPRRVAIAIMAGNTRGLSGQGKASS